MPKMGTTKIKMKQTLHPAIITITVESICQTVSEILEFSYTYDMDDFGPFDKENKENGHTSRHITKCTYHSRLHDSHFGKATFLVLSAKIKTTWNFKFCVINL